MAEQIFKKRVGQAIQAETFNQTTIFNLNLRRVEDGVADAKRNEVSPCTYRAAFLMDEKEFYRRTGMLAPAPARVALTRLLNENVTAKALSRVWRNELVFEEIDVPRFIVTPPKGAKTFTYTMGVLWMISAGGLLLAGIFKWNPQLIFSLWMFFLLLTGGFVVVFWAVFMGGFRE